ncbi:MAG: prenyltransferase [Phycisphaerae bacterium]|nr:prenyltransferase [Phycisphaerae bacterium]|tara:strand:- start:567 stop:1724 length:1158 start_codon:yes stop_codon:yes gene_type:complete
MLPSEVIKLTLIGVITVLVSSVSANAAADEEAGIEPVTTTDVKIDSEDPDSNDPVDHLSSLIEHPEGAENIPADDEMDAYLLERIQRGLAYLSGQQEENGSFGRGRFSNHVAITSLAALAFMADGHVPGRGPYGDQVQSALEFILDNAQESGLIAAQAAHGPMYGHGFATLFLGEIYGMSLSDDRVREVLEKAVDLIVRTQNREGGWRYQPVPVDADVSVTICQVMALRSARNAGIKVPRSTIERAVRYIRDCQNIDGGFRYMTRAGSSAWPRTAAGVAALFYAGIYEDNSINRGLGYLIRTSLPGSTRVRESHYYYGQYYAVQSMYLAGGSWWRTWWPAIRETLLRRQSANGGWLDHHIGGAYSTSMALIILQMPKRYLPIFQR